MPELRCCLGNWIDDQVSYRDERRQLENEICGSGMAVAVFDSLLCEKNLPACMLYGGSHTVPRTEFPGLAQRQQSEHMNKV